MSHKISHTTEIGPQGISFSNNESGSRSIIGPKSGGQMSIFQGLRIIWLAKLIYKDNLVILNICQ